MANRYQSLDDANMRVDVVDLRPEIRPSIVRVDEMAAFRRRDRLTECRRYDRNRTQMVRSEMERTISNLRNPPNDTQKHWTIE